jgi:hypothetical protein
MIAKVTHRITTNDEGELDRKEAREQSSKGSSLGEPDDPLPKQVLLQTKDAELWHSPGRTRPGRQYLLERVRAELRGRSVNSLLRAESPSMSSFQ